MTNYDIGAELRAVIAERRARRKAGQPCGRPLNLGDAIYEQPDGVIICPACFHCGSIATAGRYGTIRTDIDPADYMPIECGDANHLSPRLR